MKAFMYGLGLQLKLDIRSKSILITGYLIPLIFFVFVGGIFKSVNPEAQHTLIQSMTILGVSMGGLIGLPPSLVEIYSGDIKKVYKSNGVPLYLVVVTHFISAFIHLSIMSVIIFFAAPIIYDATIPSNMLVYIVTHAIFIATTLGIGSVLGLGVKNISKLTMISQIVFMPSIMLSGIMFPAEMLPKLLQYISKIFPATWAFKAMLSKGFDFPLYIPMILVFVISVIICGLNLYKKANR